MDVHYDNRVFVTRRAVLYEFKITSNDCSMSNLGEGKDAVDPESASYIITQTSGNELSGGPFIVLIQITVSRPNT